MKLLLIHSDYLEFKTTEKTKIAEDTDRLEGRMEECLTVFTAVEKEDEKDQEAVVKNALNEIIKVAKNLKVNNIVVYPYAHLSSDLASPEVAKRVLVEMERRLKEMGYNVLRAPFGWYKAFKISCKGHPLSELSRKITCDIKEEEKEKEKGESKIYLLDVDGERLVELREDNIDEVIKDEDLKSLAYKELGIKVKGEEKGEPPHVKYIREKEICDYEPSSDHGHFRWYPKGKLIRDLLADYVYNIVVDYGGMPVETPVMYNLENRAIREHADKFGERQYRFIQGDRELMLRFAACFGQFMMKRDMYILPRYLPLKLYELSTYSFRYEQRGELVGLKRLRAFTMPDMHTVCLDMEQAMEEFENQLWMCLKTGEDLDLSYSVIFRFTEDFFQENREWFFKLAKKYKERYKRDVLIELLPERKHYWVGKVDMAVIDSLGRPIENPTVQIDIESAKRFEIKVHDGDREIYPVILHCSPTGSIERVICALLEKAYKDLEEGKLPMLPLWLSPVQVRVIPVSDAHKDYALEVVKKLRENNIRVDLDDRDESVGKKIRKAGKDWIPYVVVVGDKEVEEDILTVTVRKRSTLKKSYKEKMKVEELIKRIKEETKGCPYRPLTLPMYCSLQPAFK
ncbi:threonine--tRNA ligase [Methanofervidicoccus sp. A16]|uniref:threonine--tRNA ligase n=1 Tax=Methanofervidicoccus sp. A16 TaxID=2607662 RepID=UPI00118C48B6|nr:threonine--tRNA ligase [Methanofervidicoccus sp. A16]AXI25597.1 threonine--tRNA ligase [Methanofervidicoccus sp. A16]